MFKLPFEHKFISGEAVRWYHWLSGIMDNFKAIKTKLNELENKGEEPKINENCCKSMTIKETLKDGINEVAKVLIQINILSDNIESDDFNNMLINVLRYQTKTIYKILSDINSRL